MDLGKLSRNLLVWGKVVNNEYVASVDLLKPEILTQRVTNGRLNIWSTKKQHAL